MLPVITVIGRVGKDPVTRETKNGSKVTSFSMACDRRKNDERGTMWVNITIWGDLIGNMKIEKGSALTVTGQFDTSTYTNKDGKEITNIEVNAGIVNYSPSSGQKSDNNNGGGNSNASSDTSWGGADETEW